MHKGWLVPWEAMDYAQIVVLRIYSIILLGMLATLNKVHRSEGATQQWPRERTGD